MTESLFQAVCELTLIIEEIFATLDKFHAAPGAGCV